MPKYCIFIPDLIVVPLGTGTYFTSPSSSCTLFLYFRIHDWKRHLKIMRRSANLEVFKEPRGFIKILQVVSTLLN